MSPDPPQDSDDPVRAAFPRTRQRFARWLTVAVCTALGAFSLLLGLWTYSYDAVCPKCLQPAASTK